MKQLEAYYKGILKSHFKVVKVVDGDGAWVQNVITGELLEIRLLGIDAPEIKKCKKLLQDEKETHLSGQLLIKLGVQSYNFLRNILPKDANVSFFVESNEFDVYGRVLAYLFLDDGSCVNEIMVQAGYAKAFDKYHCSQLSKYQQHQMKAKEEKRGHFSVVQHF
jgi:micrococcal nuclease